MVGTKYSEAITLYEPCSREENVGQRKIKDIKLLEQTNNLQPYNQASTPLSLKQITTN